MRLCLTRAALLNNSLMDWPLSAGSKGALSTEHSAFLQVIDLYEHYCTVAQEGTLPRFLGRDGVQLPCPLWDAAQWHDVEQIGAGKLVFLARRQDTAGVHQVLVKFTQQYGTATHRAWAAAGWVPQLEADPIALPGGWLQIQMEYLSPAIEEGVSGWLTLSYLLTCSPRPSDHLKQLLPALEARQLLLDKAQQLLKAAHRVLVSGQPAAHGDARPDNILVLMQAGEIVQLKLIDLDWAGIAGEAVYPILLNTRGIQWPAGAAAGLPLQQQHDCELLKLQVDPATAAGTNDWRRLTPHSIPSEVMETEVMDTR